MDHLNSAQSWDKIHREISASMVVRYTSIHFDPASFRIYVALKHDITSPHTILRPKTSDSHSKRINNVASSLGPLAALLIEPSDLVQAAALSSNAMPTKAQVQEQSQHHLVENPAVPKERNPPVICRVLD